jgi:hypothetical protein
MPHQIRPRLLLQRHIKFALIVGTTLLLVSCARHYTPDSIASPYGFFSGIWHGFVFPYAIITNGASWLLSLFGIHWFQSIEIIGRPNTDVFFYYIGFFFGLTSYGGAGAAANH